MIKKIIIFLILSLVFTAILYIPLFIMLDDMIGITGNREMVYDYDANGQLSYKLKEPECLIEAPDRILLELTPCNFDFLKPSLLFIIPTLISATIVFLPGKFKGKKNFGIPIIKGLIWAIPTTFLIGIVGSFIATGGPQGLESGYLGAPIVLTYIIWVFLASIPTYLVSAIIITGIFYYLQYREKKRAKEYTIREV